MRKNIIWSVAIGIGIADAILLFAFELVGVNMTDWLWNDVLHTDEHRWLVIPVAIGLGLVFTLVIKVLGDKRVVSTDSDLLAEMNGAPTTLRAIGVILAIGAVSLLAGASLGPEAALMAASAAIGAYVATKMKADSAKQTLVLASVGALLVAFVGSLLLVLIPMLLLLQGAKKQQLPLKSILKPAAVMLVAGVASLVTILGIDALTNGSGGYGTLPPLPAFALHDLIIAVVLGFVAAALALGLNWFIQQYNIFALWLDKQRFPLKDWVLSMGFSFVLGLLYLFGGQTIQFSGSIGSHLLMQNFAAYGSLALLVLIVTKLLATAWSKGTGYRGGLVFPSIYVGVALGLLFELLFPGWGGVGAILGAISGMLTAVVGSPVIAGIFLVAFLPPKLELWLVAFCAIFGTVLFSLLSKWLKARYTPKTA